jgi:TolB-like protein
VVQQISSVGISPRTDGEEPIYAPTAADIHAALEQVLGSHAFRAADSQRAFLRFVAEEAIAGRSKKIKEYSIAIEALGRGTDFDPRLDPIVRTQARKLRARLALYYETEGNSDAIRIALRKGSYVPVFQCAEDATTSPDESLVSREDGVILALCAAAFQALRHREQQLAARDGRASLAVFPLVAASGEPGERILGDSLFGALIESLSCVPDLQIVRGTPGVTPEKSAVREIGRTLHVRSVLTGTLSKAGNRITVRVQLRNAGDGACLWSGSYEGDACDAQRLEREIAGEVIDVLHPGTSTKR